MRAAAPPSVEQRRAASRAETKSSWIPIGGALAIIFLLGFQWFSGDSLPFTRKLIATATLVCSILPLLIYRFERRRPVIPFFALNCLFYFFSFGLTGFQETKVIVIESLTTPEGWISGGTVGLLGLVCQIVGYYVIRNGVTTSSKPVAVIRGLLPQQILTLAYGMIGLRFLMMLVPSISELPSIGQFLKLTPYVGFGLFLLLHYSNRLSLFNRLFLFALALPVEILYRASIGAVYDLIILFIHIFLMRWIVQRVIDWRLIVLGVVSFAVLNPIKHEFRRYTWEASGTSKMAISDKLYKLGEVFLTYWFDPEASSERLSDNLLSRLNHLAIAAAVCEQTPNGGVPYWNGESLTLGLYSFIPRVLWRDKPGMSIANEFGRRYQIISQQDEYTTVNVTWTVDMYMNFGFGGVIVGMAIIGAAFAFLERLFATPGTALIDVVLPFSITFPLVYPESNISSMWGGVFIGTITVYFVAWTFVIRRGSG